jgi:hypothetical protein
MKKFSNSNEQDKCIVSYKEKGELKIEFELSYLKIDGKNLQKKGLAINPDPDGLASLKEFDPSGEFKPMKMFIYNCEGCFIKILIPLEELDDEYIRVTIENSERNEMFSGMLTKI